MKLYTCTRARPTGCTVERRRPSGHARPVLIGLLVGMLGGILTTGVLSASSYRAKASCEPQGAVREANDLFADLATASPLAQR
jgi:hypothetical protein